MSDDASAKADAKKAAKQAAKDAKLEKLRLKQEKQEQLAEAKAKKQAEQQSEAAAAPAAATSNNNNNDAADDAPFVNTTPAGEKKDLSAPMAAKYNPVAVESAWYEWWEKSGFFKPARPESANKFVIVIPPPNVTGSLHLGHALTNSVQDTLTRWRRMCGDDTLWVPGTDHAGIATQRVVESRLLRDEKKTRHDLGRDAFVARVWEWKQKYGSYICKQLRLLGSSLDWDREAFTMDDNLSAAVTECFVRFFDDGLIYRANRLVNWCCALETAISDIEVEYIDIEKPTKLKVPGHDENKRYPFGVIVKFAYKVVGSDDELVVATTRIETMLGDTAVAVHPDDARYKHLHGKMLQHPFVDRQIPIVLDPVLVNMEFGTGAVKVTPAHDPNDYQAGTRNKLEFINIFTTSGLMNDKTGQFAGMKRFDARLAVLDALRAKGLHRGEDPNPMRLGLCSRTNDVIEPMMQPQWWVAMKDMADDAVALVRSGELEIVPKQPHETTWYSFLENCQDWCISRQLWWGHQVPAWLVCVDGAPLPSTETASWVAARSEDEALAKARAKHAPAIDAARITLRRDPDVLDTWFSSGLFPFSVFGWPRETADMARFFPTSVLETGHDILFFWVARMVMMSRRLTGKLPFKRVLLHAMVRDAHGRKMSKSLGNVIDPMDVMRGITLEQLHEQLRGGNLPPAEVEVAIKGQQADYPNGIPECGTDALRFGLCAYMSQGRSINLDVSRVVAYRHFCNKLWNVTRFALSHLPADEFTPLSHAATAAAWASGGAALHTLERWMLASVRRAIAGVNENFASFNLGNAVQAVYVLWYDELCDKFLEAIKPIMYAGKSADATPAQKALRASVQQTLYSTLDIGLRLLHPLMPFVTEELWQRLPRRPDETSQTIMLCAFPIEATAPPADAAATADVQLAFSVINAVRSLRGAYQIVPKVQTPLQVRCASAALRDALLPLQASILFLSSSTGGDCVLAADAGAVPPGTAVLAATAEVEALLSIGSLIDCAALRTLTQGKLEKVQAKVEQLRARMAGSNYANVQEVAREKDRENLSLWETEIDTHQKSIANFESFLAQQQAK